jgi:hypothetical protein
MKTLQNITKHYKTLHNNVIVQISSSFKLFIGSILMTSLLILGSCQELQEIPIAQEESIEIKFDRLRFIGAVSEASKEYASELRNPVKNKNFRTIYKLSNHLRH